MVVLAAEPIEMALVTVLRISRSILYSLKFALYLVALISCGIVNWGELGKYENSGLSWWMDMASKVNKCKGGGRQRSSRWVCCGKRGEARGISRATQVARGWWDETTVVWGWRRCHVRGVHGCIDIVTKDVNNKKTCEGVNVLSSSEYAASLWCGAWWSAGMMGRGVGSVERTFDLNTNLLVLAEFYQGLVKVTHLEAQSCVSGRGLVG
ncbi:hypothetical protein Tco_1201789 [Tanacetum coccineum]